MAWRRSFANKVRTVETLAQFFATALSSGLADWGLGIAFVAVCALLLARMSLKLPRSARKATAPAVVQDAAELPLASREPENPATLGEMQAQAAFQIDAAEHALNRLLAECAPLAAVSVSPTVTAQRELPKAAEKPDRSSLAA